jgi:uncharacterized membrane protein
MRHLREFIVASLVGGLLIVVPVYFSILLLLKAMKVASGLVRPIAVLLPEWVRAETLLSFFLVLFVSFLVGAAARTQTGRTARERIEKSLFEKLPGYSLFQSLTQQVAGSPEQNMWKPALAEIAGALVIAFVIEELDDGRFTIFAPSAPAPVSGSVYVMPPDRVHLLDLPLTRAVKAISRWGSGSNELVAAMRTDANPTKRTA